MRGFVFLVVLFGFFLNLDHAFELRKGQKTERISGNSLFQLLKAGNFMIGFK